MKAYIECVHDEVLKLSTGRYARMHVIVPQREEGNYQKYHLGECVMQQDGQAHAMKAYIECIEDKVMEHSASRYAKLVVTIPEFVDPGDREKKDCGIFPRGNISQSLIVPTKKILERLVSVASFYHAIFNPLYKNHWGCWLFI